METAAVFVVVGFVVVDVIVVDVVVVVVDVVGNFIVNIVDFFVLLLMLFF